MKRMTLETETKIGIPNSNKIVYFEDEFNDMIRNISGIKLTGGMFLDKNYMDNLDCYNHDNFYNIDPKSVIGNVIEIKDGEIVVDVFNRKLDILKAALDKGYKPGMRYRADLSRPRQFGIRIVKNMKLICFDLVI